MKTLQTLLIAISLSMTSFLAVAQTVSGTVVDAETGDPIVGATVLEVGTSNGVATGFNGDFTIELQSSNGKIQISYVGYTTYEISSENMGEGLKIALQIDGTALQQVVISANRVEEDLQKVNVAASVISRKDIAQQSVQTSTEVLATVPNVITDSYGPSLTNISIRGLSTNFDGVGLEQAVGMYINDVYQSRAYGFNSLIMDVDRVEVLRGPQGTLFGKNTVGGVVNIIAAQPKMANLGAIEVSGGNFDYLNLRGMANVQLIEDKMALRVSGAYTQREGSFVDHIDPAAQAVNKTEFYGLRGSLLIKPSENVDISLEGYYAKDNSAEASFLYLSSPDLIAFDPVLFAADDLDNRKASFSEPFTFDRTQFGLSGRVIAALGDNTLTAVTAYSSSKDNSIQDVEVSAIPAVYLDRTQEFGTFSQEVRLNSPRDQKLNYVAGLYYVNEAIKGNDIGNTQEFLPPLLGPDFGIDDLFIPGYAESVENLSEIDNNSFAVFGSVGYKFTDKLSLNAGLRFTTETKSFETQQTTVESQDAIDAVGFPLVWLLGTPYDKQTFNNTDNVLTGDIGLTLQASENSLVYGKFSRGFKGTGYNFAVSTYLNFDTFDFDPITEANVLYKPEFINSFEVGFKSSLSSKVRLNGAAFYIDYKDKQELIFVGTTNLIANAAESSGFGAELELNAIVAKGFQINASTGLLKMQYDKFEFPQVDPISGELVTLDLSGNDLAKVPNFTFSLSPQYTTTFKNNSNLTFRVDVNHTGQSFNDIFNTVSIQRRSATITNARIGYAFGNGKYNIGVWGKNLTDELYFGHGFQGLIGDFVSVNQGRTAGIDFRVNIN